MNNELGYRVTQLANEKHDIREVHRELTSLSEEGVEAVILDGSALWLLAVCNK